MPQSAGAPLRILVVDDSRFARRMIRLLLERAGDIEVAGEAADGREGLSQYRTLRPDVVTLDLDMPELSGLGMLRELRRESAVPVVLVTGLPVLPAGVQAEAAALGIEALVVKTFSPRSLDLSVFADELVSRVRGAVRPESQAPSGDLQPE